MNISCLALDAAMDALIQVNFDDQERMDRFSSYENSGFAERIQEMKQSILVRKATYNELFNARLAVYGFPQ